LAGFFAADFFAAFFFFGGGAERSTFGLKVIDANSLRARGR
jgi:hypothetical protein